MKIKKKHILLFVTSLACAWVTWWTFSIFTTAYALRNDSTEIRKKVDSEIVAVLRCPEKTTRKVEYSIVGIAENGSEYEYEFILSEEEIPAYIRAEYPENWSNAKLSVGRLIVSFPADKQKTKSLIELPDVFWDVASDNQRKFLIKTDFAIEPQTFLFVGYEYQAKLADGSFIKLPYFDLIFWSSKDKSSHDNYQTLEKLSQTSFVDPVQMNDVDIPEWAYAQPWTLNPDSNCNTIDP